MRETHGNWHVYRCDHCGRHEAIHWKAMRTPAGWLPVDEPGRRWYCSAECLAMGEGLRLPFPGVGLH